MNTPQMGEKVVHTANSLTIKSEFQKATQYYPEYYSPENSRMIIYIVDPMRRITGGESGNGWGTSVKVDSL